MKRVGDGRRRSRGAKEDGLNGAPFLRAPRDKVPIDPSNIQLSSCFSFFRHRLGGPLSAMG
jgi:hypothetical protein